MDGGNVTWSQSDRWLMDGVQCTQEISPQKTKIIEVPIKNESNNNRQI